MTKSELRHRCRHCRVKLPSPTGNHREAFDSQGCFNSFYLHRCVVCERQMPRNAPNQRTCYRASCKTAWAQKLIFCRFLGRGTAPVKLIAETPANGPLKEPISGGRTPTTRLDKWRFIAGEIDPKALHCATVPDGAGNEWKDGRFERIEAENRRLLDSGRTATRFETLDLCADCGGTDNLTDSGPVTLCHPCSAKRCCVKLMPVARPDLKIPDDLSIPEFLRRR
jgi:hypothetical protein